MKFDLSKIEGYDALTPEEKLAKLENFEFEDVSAELAKANAELDRYKTAVSRANAEAKKYKDERNQLMSEDEKTRTANAEALEAMKTELETLRSEKQIAEYAGKYVAMGYDEALAKETAVAQAKGDYATMFANHNTFLDGYKKRVEAESLTKQPDLSAGTPPTEEDLEKAEVDKILSAIGL